MQFGSNQAIYLQIVDYLLARILSGKWKEGERIPSIRDIAVSIEVNPNTVMRSYGYLQEREIIINQRGIGYFLASNGIELAKEVKRKEFVQKTIPKVFETLNMLDISPEELTNMLEQYKNKKK
jgi:DNA-binding transcriptional regulator YhcF (GntR family)